MLIPAHPLASDWLAGSTAPLTGEWRSSRMLEKQGEVCERVSAQRREERDRERRERQREKRETERDRERQREKRETERGERQREKREKRETETA